MTRIPLLKDNHNHLFTYSSLNQAISLFKINNRVEAIKIISSLQKNTLNIATGWFDKYYTFSENELEIFPPIIICNNSLHKYIFNSQAAEHISKDFDEWVVNNNNQVWVEKNIMKILSYISGITGFNESNFYHTIQKNLEAGVCFASDMFMTDKNVFEFLKSKDFSNLTEVWTDPKLYPKLSEDYKRLCKGVKIFTDGALGASTAAIKESKGNWNTVLNYNDDELNKELELIFEMKTAIAIHCIGDIAIEQVINALKNHRRNHTSTIIRLEHVQFINKSLARMAKDLGLILSMQPNFNLDSLIYNDRLTNQYCENNNPFRMLIDEFGFEPGIDLIFGSDGMPTGVEGSLQQSLFPPAPGQKISLDEFVAAYCTDNFGKGFVNVEIDQLKKKVSTNVTISS